MHCSAPSCGKEAVDTVVYEGRTRCFCAGHAELAKMAMALLEVRATSLTPTFEAVNTVMNRGH